MNTPAHKPILPGGSDDELGEERSSVRPRVERPSQVPASARPVDHLAVLIRQAKVLLADLPAEASRSHLLKLAITRRDEVLLERLIALESSATTPPASREDR